ncbi:MAG: 16S rRNA (cytosine(967)-C(5))-methyltransferase RsmB [Oscillospiraceae bacterium]|nr:16S rRNA (cytosine(967)-C(5))-methyltransferase RsmB [Oscillospiraceae bacterium]
MDNARTAALEILERCRRNGAWSSVTLDAVITKYKLDKRSAALASGISLGVMQNSALCDFYIDCFSNAKIEPKVRDILRCAVFQMLFMDRIPHNAAVNEAVEQAKSLGYSRASGFVNAVLRRISANIDKLPDIPGKGTAEYLSVKYSHPRWLTELIVKEQGYEFAEAFFAANNTAPETDLQVNTNRISAGEFEKLLNDSGVEFKRHGWLQNCFTVKGNVSELIGYKEGYFYVQDSAARSAVSVLELEPGMKVLDACAAPGGKSFAAAIDMSNSGSILSCDMHEKKLSLIRNGAERLGITVISTEAADARKERSELFDAIIADVPCSGLGVIRKKPEIRYKKPEELESLPNIQLDILNNLAGSLKVGGAMIYSTCTVLRSENEDVVKAFLSENTGYVTEKFTLPNGKTAANGMYTFWPNVDGTDGFFVCRIRRMI